MPYQLSRDYARLWSELQQQTIICFADWRSIMGKPVICRDVCQTIWTGTEAAISCRGVTYAWGDNEADFIRSCQEANIEAVFPVAATLCKLVALDWDERTITLEWPDGVPSLIASAVFLEVDLSPLVDDYVPPDPKPGTWPQLCVQRAFVEGAQWWQFHGHGSTMFGSERDQAEVEAVRKYGEPEGSTGVE